MYVLLHLCIYIHAHVFCKNMYNMHFPHSLTLSMWKLSCWRYKMQWSHRRAMVALYYTWGKKNLRLIHMTFKSENLTSLRLQPHLLSTSKWKSEEDSPSCVWSLILLSWCLGQLFSSSKCCSPSLPVIVIFDSRHNYGNIYSGKIPVTLSYIRINHHFFRVSIELCP